MNFRDLNGLLLVDKPSGITSHDMVASLRRLFGIREIGHSGTLDPLASGLMVCLLNEGTKLSQYLLEGDKAYHVKMQFGLQTDTLDCQGEVIKNEKVEVSQKHLMDVAAAFQGEMELPVPIYSAMKINGKKLYEYARANQEIEIPKKNMKFWDVSLIEHHGESAEFFIRCSKGSFIRTWVDEVGKKLGCGACVTSLRRVQSSQFNVDRALSLQEIGELVAALNNFSEEGESSTKRDSLSKLELEGTELRGQFKRWSGAFISMSESLPHLKKIRIQGQDETLLLNGQISHRLRGHLISRFDPQKDISFQILSQESGRLLGLIELQEKKGFTIRRVFR